MKTETKEKVFELVPIYDGRKSFYKKAKVIENRHSKFLKSYNTKVASILYSDNDIIKVEVYGIYSNTTLRHVKEFLKQNGFKAENKNQIKKDYIK